LPGRHLRQRSAADLHHPAPKTTRPLGRSASIESSFQVMQPSTSTISKVWALPLLLATGLDALAFAVLMLGAGATSSRLAAIALHLLAFGVAGLPTGVSPSQRLLMAALTLALPVLGAPVALLALATRGRGEIGQVPAREAPVPRSLTVADVRRLTDGLSASESLMSGSLDERSATVGMLTRHPDAAAIALLRRAVAAGDADLAVEAALALEDLAERLETSAAVAHEDLDANPGFERALAAADMLAAAVHSGLPDVSLLASLVADARRGYERAAGLCAQRLPELAVRWARFELDASSLGDGIVRAGAP
jgi:hypothetical protein